MIYDATVCMLGEGPLWHPEREDLFWFDIINHRLHCKSRHWQFDRFVSAAGWVDKETLLIATETDLSRFDIESGSLTPLCQLEHDNPITRSNDGRADPQGGFWIGTMGIGADPRPGAGSIWRYYKGELRKLYGNITVTNAISFAPEGDTAYFCDTPTQKIMRVRLDSDGWPKGDPECHVDLTGTDFRPDGAVVDQSGVLWSAQWGAGRVAGYDLSGREIESFHFPASRTTCPAFGGPDMKTLFCTSAAVTLPKDADHGKTFAIDTSHVGQTEHRVIL